MKTKKIFSKEFKKVLPLYLIMLSLVILMGTSYALLRSRDSGTNPYIMNIGNLEVTFENVIEENKLKIENTYPMTDSEGLNQNKELTFTITNKGNMKAMYDVYIEETSTDIEFKNVIRFVSKKENESYLSAKTLGVNNYIEQDGIINSGDSITYKVKAWLAESANNNYMNKEFKAKVVVSVKQIATIQFDANGGTVSPINKEIAANSQKYGELPTPVNGNFEFDGWYTDVVDGEEVTDDTVFTYGMSPTTLYAHWN